MSKYTTELRYICENYAGLDKSEGYNSISDIIANSRNKVFDFSYPIFDESYRSVLETKIIKHFYTREICTETVGQWKHFLDMRMNEIMPYYNKLYESELIEFNPIYDVDLTRDHTKEVNGTKDETGSFAETDSTDAERVGTNTDTVNTQSVTNGTANGTRNIKGTRELESTKDTDGTTTNTGTENLTDNDKLDRWDNYQDTPQGGLTGVQLENYLTNARHITEDKTGSTKVSTNNSTNNVDTTEETNSTETTNNTETTQSTENTTLNSTQTSNGRTTNSDAIDTNKTGSHETNETLNDLEDYLEHVKGKTGGVSYSKLLNEFRETFLNIDALIISDLRDLFFNLW